ncbi:MAG: DUF2550 domain-containing protein [Jatrophihabitantaceae bacterium]
MTRLVENVGLLVACLVFVGGLAAWLLVLVHQRRMVSSAGGLPVALKRGEQRWANGVGRYAGDEFIWYRTLSLSPTAALRIPRTELSVVSTRVWTPSRDMALRPNLMIVECRLGGADLSLGFPDNGLTGFLSWLEASAPRF